jgi:hypothetical protein
MSHIIGTQDPKPGKMARAVTQSNPLSLRRRSQAPSRGQAQSESKPSSPLTARDARSGFTRAVVTKVGSACQATTAKERCVFVCREALKRAARKGRRVSRRVN